MANIKEDSSYYSYSNTINNSLYQKLVRYPWNWALTLHYLEGRKKAEVMSPRIIKKVFPASIPLVAFEQLDVHKNHIHIVMCLEPQKEKQFIESLEYRINKENRSLKGKHISPNGQKFEKFNYNHLIPLKHPDRMFDYIQRKEKYSSRSFIAGNTVQALNEPNSLFYVSKTVDGCRYSSKYGKEPLQEVVCFSEKTLESRRRLVRFLRARNKPETWNDLPKDLSTCSQPVARSAT